VPLDDQLAAIRKQVGEIVTSGAGAKLKRETPA